MFATTGRPRAKSQHICYIWYMMRAKCKKCNDSLTNLKFRKSLIATNTVIFLINLLLFNCNGVKQAIDKINA